ncbi:BA14K family protein [Nitratireductor sp. GCM10026969]|uniref:BA14K family protein n=1 Tax=Nitratireductor sp. GCM10026969 TaxID=3252645 RepID=UPI00361BCA54
MKTLCCVAIAILTAGMPVAATADPWKDESGHERWMRYERGDRDWHPRHRHRHYRDRDDDNVGAVIGGLAAGAIIGGLLANQARSSPAYRSDRHVEWCLSRYRSYDVRTDTFQPYNGPRRYCDSPYR